MLAYVDRDCLCGLRLAMIPAMIIACVIGMSKYRRVYLTIYAFCTGCNALWDYVTDEYSHRFLKGHSQSLAQH